MQIKTRQNINGNIVATVEFKGKTFVRIQKNKFDDVSLEPIVEWKNKKTNHLVNAIKFKVLEEIFKKNDNTFKIQPAFNETSNGSFRMTASGSTMFFGTKPNVNLQILPANNINKNIDERIIEHLKHGSLLSAIKYYKEATGAGLKEAKDYVDSINANYIAQKKWDSAMSLTNQLDEREKKALKEIEKTFKTNAYRKRFIAKAKDKLKNSSPLEVVKYIKETTGCGLYECKVFFDTFIKK